MTRKLIEFAKMCCGCNTHLKLALRTSVMAVTLLVLVNFGCTHMGCNYCIILQWEYLVCCSIIPFELDLQ